MKNKNKLKLSHNEIEKKIKEYLKKPYTIKLIPEEDGTYFVEIEELRGCFSTGDTVEDAMNNIKEAMELWLQTALEQGHKIPEPEILQDYSGKILLRVPKEMHRLLLRKAKVQGVSLNQFILYLLSYGIGRFDMMKKKDQQCDNSFNAELKAKDSTDIKSNKDYLIEHKINSLLTANKIVKNFKDNPDEVRTAA